MQCIKEIKFIYKKIRKENKNMLKQFVNRIIYPNHYSNEAYVSYLRRGGAKIGEGTYFYGPKRQPVDETSLPFIEIGKNCRITVGVRILAHDYSYAVLRPIYHCMLFKTGVTKIGNNVFIGLNSIITMGVTIGNNVIIGAGSVVTRDIPDNVVAAGNPCKVICSMEEYYKKNLERFELYAKTFYERKSQYLGRELQENEMVWFTALWESEQKKEILSRMKVDGDDRDKVFADIMSFQSKYKSFDDFKEKVIGFK